MIHVAEAMGWMTLIDAPTRREALKVAQDRAASASLLRSDIQLSNLRPATADDVAWFRAMA